MANDPYVKFSPLQKLFAGVKLPWGSLAGVPTTMAGFGIQDGVSNIDPRLSDAREPVVHSNSHCANGCDPVDPLMIGAATPVTVAAQIMAALATVPNLSATVTQGATGSAPSLSVSGTTAAPVLNFTLPPGATGATGAMGATGTNGINGAAATIAVGTVSTGTAGSNASVTNGGTANAAVLNFIIPQGAQGIQGIQGVPGLAALSGSFNFSNGTIIVIGAVTSFNVTVTGARVGMVAMVNGPAGFGSSLSGPLEAAVVANDTVQVSFKAALAIGITMRTFYVRVIQ